MEFDTSSPIWLQLVQEFSRRIAAGDWEPGARIQGVRELAADLGVNPNTVQRSLAELERDGLCHSERTAGRFVTTQTARLELLRRDLAVDAVDDVIRRTRGFGMSHSEVTTLLNERWTAHDDDHDHDRAGENRVDV